MKSTRKLHGSVFGLNNCNTDVNSSNDDDKVSIASKDPYKKLQFGPRNVR
jgi:hypothetical protein